MLVNGLARHDKGSVVACWVREDCLGRVFRAAVQLQTRMKVEMVRPGMIS